MEKQNHFNLLRNLNILTWNATGVMTGIPYLLQELNDNDISICGLAEHWLLDQNAYILHTLHNDYNAHVVSCSNPRTFNGRTFGKGGVALLWHRRLDRYITIVESDSDRIAALKITAHGFTWFVIQIYLPCSSEPIEKFKSEVDKLNDVLALVQQGEQVIIMGDCNVRIDHTVIIHNTREAYIAKMINNHSLFVVTRSDICTGSNYSFHPGANNSPSLIDHILVDENTISSIRKCNIIEDAPLNISRHLPILLCLNLIDTIPVIHDTMLQHKKHHYKWSSLIHRDNYCTDVTARFNNTNIDFRDLNWAYDLIVSGLISSSEKCIPKKMYKRCLKPYWSETLKHMHKAMQEHRQCWSADGKPRSGILFERYKEAKRIFRKHMRNAAKDYERAEYEQIDDLVELDQKAFWKIINSRRKSRNGHAKCNGEIEFNGVIERDQNNILRGWHSYFSDLYSFSENAEFDSGFKNSIDQAVHKHLSSNEYNYESCCLTDRVTVDELSDVIRALPNNKTPSIDNITYEHLKYGGSRLTEILTDLINAILEQETLPDKCKEGLTITVHKGNGKSAKDPNNYRAISLLPTIYKLFEKLFLKRIETINFNTRLHPLQFGFQKGKSSKMTSFIFQEASNYCIERKSTLYSCFMDATKAFDNTWYNGLLYKLHELGITGKPLRIINQMLNGGSSRILLHGQLSESFQIMQGTRQGSICSPFFYTVFLNELLCELDSSQYGFKINSIPLCSPTQADDIVLLSLSKHGLQNLIQICKRYADKWRYSYNPQKCCLLVINDKRNSDHSNMYYSNSQIEHKVSYKHLGIMQTQTLKNQQTLMMSDNRPAPRYSP